MITFHIPDQRQNNYEKDVSRWLEMNITQEIYSFFSERYVDPSKDTYFF